jgi:hypothetical protein
METYSLFEGYEENMLQESDGEPTYFHKRVHLPLDDSWAGVVCKEDEWLATYGDKEGRSKFNKWADDVKGGTYVKNKGGIDPRSGCPPRDQKKARSVMFNKLPLELQIKWIDWKLSDFYVKGGPWYNSTPLNTWLDTLVAADKRVGGHR